MGHHGFLEAQRKSGRSTHFPETWKNPMGFLKARAKKAARYTWTRWEAHASQNNQFWEGRTAAETIFKPDVAAVAHYLGQR